MKPRPHSQIREKKTEEEKPDLSQVTRRMRAVLDALGYDFSRFTMEDFRAWLEWCRGRRIEFVPWTFESSISGGWLACPAVDLVFFHQDTLPIHQAHIQLHEMSHILCSHLPVQLGQVLSEADVASLEALLLRSGHTEREEMEAEVLASLVQQRVLDNSRLQELGKVVSSSFDEHFARYIALFEPHGK